MPSEFSENNFKDLFFRAVILGKLSALENDGVVVTLKEFKRIKTQYVPAAGDLGEANVFDINSAGSDDGDFSVNEVLMSYLI